MQEVLPRFACFTVAGLIGVVLIGVRPPAAQAADSLQCAAARAEVEDRGAVLPPGIGFECPGSTYDAIDGRTSWGLSCWPGSPCSDDRPKVAVDGSLTGEKLRYVIAHEICHHRARLGLEGPVNPLDEAAMDDCAARYGFPNKYFGRRSTSRPAPAPAITPMAQLPVAPEPVPQVPRNHLNIDWSSVLQLLKALAGQR